MGSELSAAANHQADSPGLACSSAFCPPERVARDVRHGLDLVEQALRGLAATLDAAQQYDPAIKFSADRLARLCQIRSEIEQTSRQLATVRQQYGSVDRIESIQRVSSVMARAMERAPQPQK